MAQHTQKRFIESIAGKKPLKSQLINEKNSDYTTTWIGFSLDKIRTF